MELYNELSMVIKFPLIKHESMGHGIVIHNDGHRIVEVGFSHDGIKNLSLDNPFISASYIPVLEFINEELYEYIFDENTKKKATPYISAFNIKSLEVNEYKIFGSVIGTEEYHFSIETSNGYVLFDCSCPVIGLCKHLYAACVFIKKNFTTVSEKTLTPKENQSKKIRPLLDNYLYYPIDTTNFRLFFNIYNYIKGEDNLEIFLIECFSYYNRNQYHNKIIDSLLYPLTFDKEIDSYLKQYINEGDNPNIIKMINEIYLYPSSYNYQRNQNNKSHRIKYSLLEMALKEDITIFFNLEPLTDKDFSALTYCLCELLAKKELTFEEITAINDSPNFQKASRIIYGVFITYKNIAGHNGLLFIEQIDNAETLLKSAPIDFIISKLTIARTPYPFLSAVNNRFNEIKKDDYDKIIEAIVYTCLTTNTVKNTLKESITQLVDRFQDNKYLKEIVNYNLGYKPYWRY